MLVAVSLALCKQWDEIQHRGAEEIVKFYVKMLRENDPLVADLMLCCGLMGGGVVHLLDRSIRPVDAM